MNEIDNSNDILICDDTIRMIGYMFGGVLGCISTTGFINEPEPNSTFLEYNILKYVPNNFCPIIPVVVVLSFTYFMSYNSKV